MSILRYMIITGIFLIMLAYMVGQLQKIRKLEDDIAEYKRICASFERLVELKEDEILLKEIELQNKDL